MIFNLVIYNYHKKSKKKSIPANSFLYNHFKDIQKNPYACYYPRVFTGVGLEYYPSRWGYFEPFSVVTIMTMSVAASITSVAIAILRHTSLIKYHPLSFLIQPGEHWVCEGRGYYWLVIVAFLVLVFTGFS